MASQTALSLVLLVFAALFVRSLQNLWERDPGYDRTNVAMFSVDAGLAGKKGIERANTYRALLDALRALPGEHRPACPRSGRSAQLLLHRERKRAGATDSPATNVCVSRPRTLRLVISKRSAFLWWRVATSIPATARVAKVVIISEKLASKFTGNPIGQILARATASEVIGVAKDNRYASVGMRRASRLRADVSESESIGYPPSFEIRYAATPPRRCV